MKRKLNLHQKYMADYEYRMMLASYERNCKELSSYFVTPEPKKEKQSYDLDQAVSRILNRNRKEK